MSDLLVVLQSVERELSQALERRPDTRVLVMLRFAAVRDGDRTVMVLGGVTPDRLAELDDRHREELARALRRAATIAGGGKPTDELARELRADAWALERTGEERVRLLNAAAILEGAAAAGPGPEVTGI